MRFRHQDGSVVHLAYCTNVHPANDMDGVIAQLSRFCEPVRYALDEPLLGIGLWLAAPVAAELANNERSLSAFRAELERRQLEVVTLNGFPYDAFQAEVVKKQVYRPDWSEQDRFEYTLNLAKVLHSILPDDAVDGSISTLPLGWRDRDLSAAIPALARMATSLAALADEHGRPVRLAIEPEPGCLVETLAHASEVVQELPTEWIGLCLDACHAAVQFETPQDAVNAPVYKAQLSAALRVETPNDAAWLDEFDELRFLHQTRTREGGSVDDLDVARQQLARDSEWRVHFHVPLDICDGRTTQSELLDTMDYLVGNQVAVTRHLEVETYTWSVLPPDRRPTNDAGLVQGIANEMRWTGERLIERGLKAES